MKIVPQDPPRRFPVSDRITITHTHDIFPGADEQVTFHIGEAEYDVVCKPWGFYATPSLNGRLARFGWRTALAKNTRNCRYILLVHRDRVAEFEAYLEAEQMIVEAWLDEPTIEAPPRREG